MTDERNYETLFHEVSSQFTVLLKGYELLTKQVAELCKMNEAMIGQVSELRKSNELLADQLQSRDKKIAHLKQIILNMQRARFGQRSEKSTYVLDDGSKQLSMFDSEEDETTQQPTPAEEAVVQPETVVASHIRYGYQKVVSLESATAKVPKNRK